MQKSYQSRISEVNLQKKLSILQNPKVVEGMKQMSLEEIIQTGNKLLESNQKEKDKEKEKVNVNSFDFAKEEIKREVVSV